MNYNYKIFSPSGNDTAIVMHNVSSKEDKLLINGAILNKHLNVEQVGFVHLENNIPVLNMAGGEFCGNATRCLVFNHLGSKTDNIQVKSSGYSGLLSAGVDEYKKVWCEIPLKSEDLNKVISIVDENTSIVYLSGITHIVRTNFDKTMSEVDFKKEALKILNENNLVEVSNASGVIFLDLDEDIKIYPVVWVSSVGTLFFETACGTGTVAAAISLAYRSKKNIKLPFLQPSNEFISCEVTYDGNTSLKCNISGYVKELYEGVIKV